MTEPNQELPISGSVTMLPSDGTVTINQELHTGSSEPKQVPLSEDTGLTDKEKSIIDYGIKLYLENLKEEEKKEKQSMKVNPKIGILSTDIPYYGDSCISKKTLYIPFAQEQAAIKVFTEFLKEISSEIVYFDDSNKSLTNAMYKSKDGTRFHISIHALNRYGDIESIEIIVLGNCIFAKTFAYGCPIKTKTEKGDEKFTAIQKIEIKDIERIEVSQYTEYATIEEVLKSPAANSMFEVMGQAITKAEKEVKKKEQVETK